MENKHTPFSTNRKFHTPFNLMEILNSVSTNGTYHTPYKPTQISTLHFNQRYYIWDKV